MKLAVGTVFSHPFDFASYIYQSKQSLSYGVDMSFYWNKGYGLVLFFYANTVAAISLHNVLGMTVESPMVYKFVASVGYLIADILSGIAIVGVLHKCKKISHHEKRSIFLLWFINPIVFWYTYVHSQYGILIVCTMLAGLYTLNLRRYMITGMLFGVAASVYYYPVVIMPLVLLYSYKQSARIRGVLLLSTGFIFTFILSILPFIATSHRRFYLDSILQHNSASSINNLSSRYNYLSLQRLFTENSDNQMIGAIVEYYDNNSMHFGLVALVVFMIYRYHKSLCGNYSMYNLVKDMLLATVIFILTIGKLQLHYVLWIVPPMIFLVAYMPRVMKRLLGILSVTTILYALTANNISVYLLDVVPWREVDYQLAGDVSNALVYIGGIVVIVILAVPVCIYGHKNALKQVSKNTGTTTELFAGVVIMAVFTGLSFYAVLNIDSNGFSSAGNVLSFKTLAYSEKTIASETKAVDIALPPVITATQESTNRTGYLGAEGTSGWYVYIYGGSAKGRLTTDVTGLKMYAEGIGTVVKASLGGNSGNSVFAVNPIDRLDAQIKITIPDTYKPKKSVDYRVDLRYLDANKIIISGSDITLAHDEDGNIAVHNISVHERARYGEVVVTLVNSRRSESSIVMDSIRLSSRSTRRSLSYMFKPFVHSEAVRDNILLNQQAAPEFEALVRIGVDTKVVDIGNVVLNGCVHNRTDRLPLAVDVYFAHTCYNSSTNTLTLDAHNTSITGVQLFLRQREAGHVPVIGGKKIGLSVFVLFVYVATPVFMITKVKGPYV